LPLPVSAKFAAPEEFVNCMCAMPVKKLLLRTSFLIPERVKRAVNGNLFWSLTNYMELSPVLSPKGLQEVREVRYLRTLCEVLWNPNWKVESSKDGPILSGFASQVLKQVT
jgi:hypothetical protein